MCLSRKNIGHFTLGKKNKKIEEVKVECLIFVKTLNYQKKVKLFYTHVKLYII